MFYHTTVQPFIITIFKKKIIKHVQLSHFEMITSKNV